MENKLLLQHMLTKNSWIVNEELSSIHQTLLVFHFMDGILIDAYAECAEHKALDVHHIARMLYWSHTNNSDIWRSSPSGRYCVFVCMSWAYIMNVSSVTIGFMCLVRYIRMWVVSVSSMNCWQNFDGSNVSTRTTLHNNILEYYSHLACNSFTHSHILYYYYYSILSIRVRIMFMLYCKLS